jgi:gentisate 1,2-dioxygenase
VDETFDEQLEWQVRLSRHCMTPGWIDPVLPGCETATWSAHHWRYSDAKAAMLLAAKLVGTDQAERRNLVLSNARTPGQFRTLPTLVCAYQSMLPGEKARSHRHAGHALRIVLEAPLDLYSLVDGERQAMEAGDIVLTPGGSWHGHGNDGDSQAFWLDVLDKPLTRLLEADYFDPWPESRVPVQAPPATAPLRFARCKMLAKLASSVAAHDPFRGTTCALAAPDMPTLALRAHRWRAGWCSRPYRQVANTVYVVLAGRGRSRIGDLECDWGFGDTMAVPAWRPLEHCAGEDALVVSISDEPLMRWARYYRFQAEDRPGAA